jgi:acyl carrier protein
MNTVAEGVKQIIAEVLNLDPDEIVYDNTFVDDLGADSLDVFQMIMGIEGKFDIDIPTDEAENISTVGEAMELIQRLIDQ